MIDVLLRDGFQLKKRWSSDGAATLWDWCGTTYETLDEAVAARQKLLGAISFGKGWSIEVELFRIERIVVDHNNDPEQLVEQAELK